MNKSMHLFSGRAGLGVLAFLSSFILHPSSFAAPWTLTTADFQTQQVELAGMTTEAVAVKVDGGVRTVPVANVLELNRQEVAGEPEQKGGAFTLVLAGGDRLTGGPTGIEGETLTWSSPAVGQMKVPLKEVRAIVKGSVQGPGIEQQAPAEDTLTLGNGDVVKGIVTGLGDGKVTVTQQGGEAVPVPLDSVVNLVFASAGKPAASGTGRAFRVRLKDGSALTAPSVLIGGGKATLKLADGSSREVMIGSVAGVEQLNGPVVYLSSLTPVEDIQRPYLGDPWPTRVDRTVTGQPLRAGGQPFTHGLGVHAYSKLTYELKDPAYSVFRTQYAIDGGGPFANVTVRVLVDGKVAYEMSNVMAGVVSKVVNVPVEGAKILVLEVDYGASNDTQDRFMWLSPALVKKGA